MLGTYYSYLGIERGRKSRDLLTLLLSVAKFTSQPPILVNRPKIDFHHNNDI